MRRREGAAALSPVGVVLAGGRSRRLPGIDKATLRLRGETLVESAARRLGELCREVVVADRERRLVPGLPSIPDGPGEGPAAGILGAAAARPGRSLLVLACDLPGVTAAVLRRLLETPGADWVVPRRSGGELEPLCALYGPRALERLRMQVEQEGRMAPRSLAASSGLTIRPLEERELPGEAAALFVNLNTREDLERLRDRESR